MSFSWSRRRSARPFLFRLTVALLVVLAAGIILFIVVERAAAPVLIEMSEARVRASAVKAMNDAVRTVLTNPLKYSDLIKITQDANGKVILLQADTLKMNDIATSTALQTQENITVAGRQGVGVPLGSLLGGELLSGRGPDIFARIIPVGSVTTAFESEFNNQGVNQTNHKIYLDVHSVVRIVVPTQSKEIEVSTKVLLTECIIVGEVPDSYVNVSTLDDLNAMQAVPEPSLSPD